MKMTAIVQNSVQQGRVNSSVKSACVASLLLVGFANESAKAESIALPLFGEWVLGPGGNCKEVPAKLKMTFGHSDLANDVSWNSIKCVLGLQINASDDYWFYVKDEVACLKRGFPENFVGKYIEVVPGHLRVINSAGIEHDMTNCEVH
jgi:hypothetical protein